MILQLLDIGKNPALFSRLHSDQTDCAVQEGETCMCTEDKMHVNCVLTLQGEQDVTHHTTLHPSPLTELYSPLQNRFRIVGFAYVCLVVLGLLGLHT